MLPLSEEELDTMVDREREQRSAPLNDWQTIAARAREEGLLRDAVRSIPRAQSSWMKIAAAVLIAIGGVGVGRYTALRQTPVQSPVASVPADQQPAQSTSPVVETPAVATSASAAGEFRSVDEAWATLNRSGAEYQKASAFLAANNSNQAPRADSSAVYQTRLAALDQVLHATRSALSRAPNDPVINQYYMATIGAHEATQQQLNAARTVSQKVRGF